MRLPACGRWNCLHGRASSFLALALLSTLAVAQTPRSTSEDSAVDVPWLAEVTTVPAQRPALRRQLRPLPLPSTAAQETAGATWEATRQELRSAWAAFLGPLPARPTSLDMKTLQRETLAAMTRELIEYAVEPGRRVRAYVLRPHPLPAAPCPGMVVFHPTTDHTSRAEAGLGGPADRNTGVQLAARGFVVVCPANFLWEEPTMLKAVEAARQRNPHSLGMATMLADGQRAVDVLMSFPEVDSQRIGACGHSLGAKETLYLMAFDDRVYAGVASEGGLGLNSTNWNAPWYLGPAAAADDFPRDHHELLALIAPRPFLVLGGEAGPGCADGERSWPYIEVGQAVSRQLGMPVRQGLLNHHEGHSFSPAAQAKAYQWLDCYVARTYADASRNQ